MTDSNALRGLLAAALAVGLADCRTDSGVAPPPVPPTLAQVHFPPDVAQDLAAARRIAVRIGFDRGGWKLIDAVSEPGVATSYPAEQGFITVRLYLMSVEETSMVSVGVPDPRMDRVYFTRGAPNLDLPPVMHERITYHEDLMLHPEGVTTIYLHDDGSGCFVVASVENGTTLGSRPVEVDGRRRCRP